MIVAIAVLVKDSEKLTLGQPLTIVAPRAIEAVIRQPPDWWLSNAHMTHYQAMLLNPEQIWFGAAVSLIPATLLPETELQTRVLHDCHQILAETHSTRKDLMDQPLPDAERMWFTDGSSFLKNSEWKAVVVVVDGEAIIWASTLKPGTSAQKAELIALTQALEKARDKKVNIYTESRYAFATAYMQGRYIREGAFYFSGWTEAFPTKRETAQIVVKKILEDIFPHFGLPKVIGSDNGPAFVSQATLTPPEANVADLSMYVGCGKGIMAIGVNTQGLTFCHL
ncbi:hypothetical protein STEG23_035505 [Scotinomys teguina]